MMVKMRLYFISIWTILDPIYYFFTRLHYLNGEGMEQPIFRIRLTRYKGLPLKLSDGTVVNRNDLMIKIHLHNVKLLKELHNIESETKKARLIYKKVLEGLPDLASHLKSHPRYNEMKGIIGISMLNKGCERLGFETFFINNKWYCLLKRIVFIPMYLLTVNRITTNSLYRPPKYLVMSKDVLIAKYNKQ
ncbi:YkoP family protein [Litchfieldia salsa]|uniref:YkoP-like domain-containing protein n=1 Tax=Litchfieldia salsa TaxID=930152 RepID=A0A1H0TGN0_9BACI|nr:hypothetical protein [Litchfieldia salsa]SDP52696.1 hypothetical protein SAMN05216565_103486 [Litchfieldia salsa]